jgi:uncharacterized membrane protein
MQTDLQHSANEAVTSVTKTITGSRNYKLTMALVFSGLFHSLALLLITVSVYQFLDTAFSRDGEIVSAAIKSINTLIISLAMFELGVGVSKEYVPDDGRENIFINIRRTITRFVGTVCIALVLESLIMIIKYSQLELAGNLFYPVGILIGGSVLLCSLGVFLWLTQGHSE